MIEKYRKKPIVTEAVYYDGANIIDVFNFIGLVHHLTPGCGMGQTVPVYTFFGTLYAMPGNYIYKDEQGEFYPCAKEIFEATYEEVSE